VLVIETDVTEQKALEAQFLRAQRLESIGALASGIAHDLNNLLSPILMTASILPMSADAAEIEESARIIEASANRCADIVRQLLTFGRGTAAAGAPVDVGAIAGDVVGFAQRAFPRSVELERRVAPGLPTITGDATQLHQVLLNLAINARDAMPGGGTLRFTVDEAVVDAQYATMTPDAKPGRYVRVEVADTGAGIAHEHLDKIFDPFFTTKEMGKGTGLGLFTVAGIVRAHGGFVRAESRLGAGARFEVFLPAAPRPEVEPGRDAAAPLSARRGRGELVLVVDDEADVRAALRVTLERRGYRVVLASDGAEALALLASHGAEIRAVVTDLMMPRMDGLAFATAALAARPGLPIAASSGLFEGQRAALEAVGVRAFLAKPYAAEPLLAVVAELVASGVGAGAPSGG
jgi:nitrogen-specific signal transduction histidine kinase/CheY-like chemotaxis protein